MNRIGSGIAPFVSAAAVPAVVVWLFYYFLNSDGPVVDVIGFTALGIAALLVLVFGVPGVIFLRWFGYVRWWSLLLLGFVAGCLPMAIWSWPSLKHSDAGWLSYGYGVVFFGACGAIGAFAYWLTDRWVTRSNNNRWRGP
jgi:hypothetical protein